MENKQFEPLDYLRQFFVVEKKCILKIPVSIAGEFLNKAWLIWYKTQREQRKEMHFIGKKNI